MDGNTLAEPCLPWASCILSASWIIALAVFAIYDHFRSPGPSVGPVSPWLSSAYLKKLAFSKDF